MASVGFNRKTGAICTDFSHLKQSLAVIFSTPLKTRVMRRDFGCELFELIDRPLTDKVILAAYVSIVYACSRWEPRFEITWCNIEKVDSNGIVVLQINGNYYPLGHIGNKTKVVKDVNLSFEYGTSE